MVQPALIVRKNVRMKPARIAGDQTYDEATVRIPLMGQLDGCVWCPSKNYFDETVISF